MKNYHERWDITTDSTQTERSMSNYYKQLYTSTLDNLEWINSYKYTTPTKTESWIENLNGLLVKKAELVINNLPIQKTPGPGGFSGEVCQTFKEFIAILLILFQKNWRTLSSSFYEASIT